MKYIRVCPSDKQDKNIIQLYISVENVDYKCYDLS